jgi:uncharacterized protein (TIGR02996 family)
MSDQAFLEDILARPEDDHPRLIYADWLEDHGGDPYRAEFIRVQCELAGLEEHDARHLDLADRQELFLRRFGDGWQPEVPREVRDGFRRGFVAFLKLEAHQWLRELDRWSAVTPVEGVWFRETHDAAEIFASPALQRLRQVIVSAGPPGFQELPRSAHLGRLEWLNLTDQWGFRDEHAERVAAADLPALVRLEIKFARMTGAGVCTLVASSRLPRLRRLDLAYNGGIGAAGVERLAALPELGRIRALDLQGCCPEAGAIEALARSPHAGGLRELHLACNSIGNEGMRGLAHSPYLGDLALLGLYNNEVGPEGVAALASSRLSRLTHLSLSSNRIGAAGGRALAATTVLTGLRRLDLDRTELGDEGVQALACSPALASVTHLDLSHNGLTAAAARALAESPYLVHLRALSLRGNQLKNEGAAALAGSSNLHQLRRLHLDRNGIRLLGARALAGSQHLGRLGELTLNDNPIGPGGAQALADSPHLPGPPCFLLYASPGTRVDKVGEQTLRARWGDGYC